MSSESDVPTQNESPEATYAKHRAARRAGSRKRKLYGTLGLLLGLVGGVVAWESTASWELLHRVIAVGVVTNVLMWPPGIYGLFAGNSAYENAADRMGMTDNAE